MNKVDSNLMAISQYVEVMDGIKLSELVKQRGEVDLMISEIGDYVKNNQIVEELEKKVEESSSVNEGLKKLVSQQKREVARKEEQITVLLEQIAALEAELKTPSAPKMPRL